MIILSNDDLDIDDSFMPWLMKEVTSELEEMVSSRDILQGKYNIVVLFPCLLLIILLHHQHMQ